MLYDVKRQHLGDRMYLPGEQREAEPREVAHLVERGVLAAPEGGKAQEAPLNKALRAPRTKAK